MLQSATINIFSSTVRATEIKIGELCIVRESVNNKYNGTLLLRSFQGFVNLKDPKQTWDTGCSLLVEHIPNATVTLMFGTGAPDGN